MFNFYQKIKSWLGRHAWLGDLAVFAIILVVYLPFQQSTAFADPDAFYHLKMAELISQQGLIRNFTWMPWTTLATSFADHHFLYHLALIPFIKIMGTLPGAKLATAVFAAAAIAAIGWSLRHMGIRHARAFALLAGLMAPLAFRINLTKASAAGVTLLVIGLALAINKRFWPLAIVSFLYVWTHGSWPALLALGTMAIVIVTPITLPTLPYFKGGEISQPPLKVRGGRWGYELIKPLVFLWGGAVAGLVINPFFPNNIKFYWEQIVQIAVINYQNKIGVGGEWYPYPPERLLADLPLLAILSAICLAVFPFLVSLTESQEEKKRLRVALALSAAAAIFLFLTLRSQRHVEYFVPLAVMAVAAWLNQIKGAPVVAFIKKYIIIVVPFALGLGAMFFVFTRAGEAKTTKDLDGSYPFTLYQQAAGYLKTHTTPGEIIVHSDWDDMPSLFYWDDANRYIIGLDPTFMYRADAGRYERYVDFTLGKAKDPVVVMRELNSRYVFSDRNHRELDAMLTASGRFERVYIDGEAEIYLLK